MPQDFLDSEDSNFSTPSSSSRRKQGSVKLGGIAAEPANSSPAKREKSRKGASGLVNGTPDERIAMLAPREELKIQAVQPCGALLARKRANGSVLLYWRTTHAGNTIREEVGIYSETANRSWKTPAEDGRYGVVAAAAKASAIALEHFLALPIGGIQGKRRHEQEVKQKAIDDARRASQARESYSVGKLAQLYAAVLIKEGKPSAREVFNAVERHVMSHPLALEAASDITNEQLAELLRPIYERGHGRQGNKVRSYLHAAFALAASSRAPMNGKSVNFEPASAEDAEALVAVRIASMRPSLEGLGHFDPQRVRDRFLASFTPAYTWHLVVAGHRVGSIAVRPQAGYLLLDHLYVAPARQGEGVGAAAIAVVMADADALGMPIRVGALGESDSNRFYERHGFKLVEETEWDNYYVRAPVVGLASFGQNPTITDVR